MEVPQTMDAIDPAACGGPETLTLTSQPVPAPQAGEVLLKVAAAGVNRPDVQQRLGNYPPPPGVTNIIGLEVSGTVVALGEGVERWRIGDEICALVAGGGYAGYVAVPQEQCLPVPAGVPLVEAAGLPETFFTVWTNLFHRGQAKAGESVLIHGGTSGIGVTAIQLAHQFGLKVFTTAGSDYKCEVARSLGADVAINYRTQDFVQVIADETGGRGVDIVFDIIGGDYFARNLEALAEEGRHISVAMQNGMKVELVIPYIMRKRLHLTGSMLRSREAAFKGVIAAELEREVWPLVASGKVKVVVDRVFPIAEAPQAHEYIDQGTHIGKILLQI